MRDTLEPFVHDRAAHGRRRVPRRLIPVVIAALAVLGVLLPPGAVPDVAADDSGGDEFDPGFDYVPGPDAEDYPLVGALNVEDFTRADGTKFEWRVPRVVGVNEDHVILSAPDHEDEATDYFFFDPHTLEQTDVIRHEDDISLGFATYDAPRNRLIGLTPPPTSEEYELCDTPVVVSWVCVAQQRVKDYESQARSGPQISVLSLADENEEITTRTLRLKLSDHDDAVVTEPRSKPFYHPPSGKLYFVTESIGVNAVFAGTGHPFTAVHQVDVREVLDAGPDETVPVDWSLEVPACTNIEVGSSVARSLRPDARFIYLVCTGDKGNWVRHPAGRMHGIVRVDLPADGEDTSDPANFTQTFTPFPGDLERGFAHIDPAALNEENDFVYLMTVAAGSVFYVYDVHRQAYTAAIELKSDNWDKPFTDPNTGRIYNISVYSGSLRVTEGRRVSVPNGRWYDTSLEHHWSGAVAYHPGTRRIFLSGGVCLEAYPSGEETWRDCKTDEHVITRESGNLLYVFEDRVPDAPAPERDDPDAGTDGVAEVPGRTVSTRSGNAQAFGARYTLVGGLRSARATNPSLWDTGELAGLKGTRDLLLGRVDATSLFHTTATEAAETDAQAVGGEFRGSTRDDLAHADPAASYPDGYPEHLGFATARCRSFDAEAESDAKPGAATNCDGAGFSASAAAYSNAAGRASPFQVGYAESATEVEVDPDLGIVSSATAVARDVSIGGLVSIGEVRTEAQAVAHGRAGTAGTTLTREFRQVAISSPGSDEPAFTCGVEDDDPCDVYEVVREINRHYQPRLRAFAPPQDATYDHDNDRFDPDSAVSNGSPGGAAAVVRKDPYQRQHDENINGLSEWDLPGLTIVYYDDHKDASRHVLQLAAVSLDAQYTINELPRHERGDDGATDDGTTDGSTGDGTTDGSTGDGTTDDDGTPAGVGDGGGLGAADGTADVVSEATEAVSDVTGDAAGEPLPGDAPTRDAQAGTAPDGATSRSADAPALSTGSAPQAGDSGPAPQVAAPDNDEDVSGPDAAAPQTGAVQQVGKFFALARQKTGDALPLAGLWLLGGAPFYLARRRTNLTRTTVGR